MKNVSLPIHLAAVAPVAKLNPDYLNPGF